MGFGESGGIEIVLNEKELPSSNHPGKPNARYDYYKNGKLIKSVWTDSNGWPIRSTHYTNHGNALHHPQVPHNHDWDWFNGKWTEKPDWY